jgi:hypothetical protein
MKFIHVLERKSQQKVPPRAHHNKKTHHNDEQILPKKGERERPYVNEGTQCDAE